jgi:hypothetical protein
VIAMMRRPLAGAIACVLTVCFAGCSSDAGEKTELRVADAYVASIRWFAASLGEVPNSTQHDAVKVYVTTANGSSIDPGAQAQVAADLTDIDDVVTISFADSRDDVIDGGVPDEPVKGDGVLLLMGSFTPGPPPADFEITVYRDANDQHRYRMRVVVDEGDETVTSVSEVPSS